MARFPGGRWAPLPENSTQTKIIPTQIILHTAVDQPGPTRLERYFAREDVGVESHFWITLDGEVVQMMDTTVRADANRYANRRPDGSGAISIETEDEGDPVGVPWTAAQLDSIEAVILWASLVHGIPLTVCQNPSDPGLGYHSMFGAPSAWTPSRGKTCPGATRIRQFEEDLLPRFSQEATTMNETAARALTEALYESLLLRAGDPGGLAHWTKVGVESGPTTLMVNFIIGAKAEIARARATQATELLALRREVQTLKNADRTPAQVIDIDGITEAVVNRVIDRLND